MSGTTTRYGLFTVTAGTDPVSYTNDLTNNWTAIDLVLGSQSCTSSTRPSAPVSGSTATETDKSMFIFYNGTAWDIPTGRARICTSSTHPTGADLFTGMVIVETDTSRILYYNGTSFIQISYTAFVCTSTTRPSVTFAGLSIFETDTLAYAVYTGSAWRYITQLTITSSARPTGSNAALAAGSQAYESDTSRTIVWSGSAWLPVSTTICTSSTHPANPLTGSQIYETNTTAEAIWNGSAYLYGAQQVASISLVASAANMTVTGIPAFNHLLVLYNGRQDTGSGGAYAQLQMNADTANHYSYQNLVGNISTASTSNAGALTSAIRMGVIACSGDTASYFGNGIISISNIQSTTPFKSAVCSYAGAVTASNGYAGVSGGLWASTAAVTSIKLLPGAGNFVAGSSLTVYGFM